MAKLLRQVGLRELRVDARRVVESAQSEGPIEITDRGRVMALIIPVPTSPGNELATRAPGLARALSIAAASKRVDTEAMEFLMANKRLDIELDERPTR